MKVGIKYERKKKVIQRIVITIDQIKESEVNKIPELVSLIREFEKDVDMLRRIKKNDKQI